MTLLSSIEYRRRKSYERIQPIYDIDMDAVKSASLKQFADESEEDTEQLLEDLETKKLDELNDTLSDLYSIQEMESRHEAGEDSEDEDDDWDDDPDSDDYINDDILSPDAEKTFGVKTLDLFKINLSLSQVLENLSGDKGKNPELTAASDFIRLAQNKMQEYSNRLRIDDSSTGEE